MRSGWPRSWLHGTRPAPKRQDHEQTRLARQENRSKGTNVGSIVPGQGAESVRSRLKIAGAAAVMMAAGALSPALAHHADEHSTPDDKPIAGCTTPPPEKSGAQYASGFTVWAASPTS